MTDRAEELRHEDVVAAALITELGGARNFQERLEIVTRYHRQARDEALEDAAKLATKDLHHEADTIPMAAEEFARDIAEQIRALKSVRP